MKKILRTNKAQQEIAGFVVIVVLVMIVMMIFLFIELGKPPKEVNNLETEALVNTILQYKTNCAIDAEPYFDTVIDLIKSSYEN